MLFSSYVTLTSDGELELYLPVADDDHVDVAGGRRGAVPRLAIQVKTALHLDRAGKVEARATFTDGVPREHPAFLYAIVYIQAAEVRAFWLVPSADFNRLAYRGRVGQGLQLHAYVSPDGTDRFTPFRLEPRQLGPRLLEILDGLPETEPPRVAGAHLLLAPTR
jgi:hypothetical protein